MESNLKKYTIVYLTYNIKNHKIYIGVHDTLNPWKFDGYLGNGINRNFPSSNNHPNTPFGYAVKKYGFDSFKRITLKVFEERNSALEYEKYIVDTDFINRPDTYNITIGGGNPPIKMTPVYQYSLDGDFVNCYESESLAALANGGKSGSSVIVAIKNKCCAFESFWSKSYFPKLNTADYTNTVQRINVYQYDSEGNYVTSYPSISAAARSIGSNLGMVQRAIASETKTKGYYFTTVKRSCFVPTITQKHTGKIFQYSLSGEYLGEFNSCLEVARTYQDKTYKRIANTLKRGYNRCGNFLWSWERVSSLNKKYIEKTKKVGKYNSNGDLIEWFDSVRSARKYYPNVSRVLSGKAAHCKGFIFKYIE